MTEKQMAKENKIFECITGSNLYGTTTENSDKDYVGIFIADKNYYYGMKEIEEVDMSVESKNINGKNNPDAVDNKLYEIRQFFKLLYNNNPNISELLFIPENNVIFCNEYYNNIIFNKNFFLDSELIKKKFQQYAYSQKKKMEVKLDHYDILMQAYKIIEESDKRFLVDEDKFNIFQFRNNINTEYKVGDIFIPRNTTIKITKKILQKRLKRVGHRQDLILKYGFDTKFGSNLIRLLLEGIELLETKRIVFPLKERQLITDIKQGKYKMTEVLEMSDELNNKFDTLKYEKFSNDYNKCNSVLVNLIDNFIRSKK
jgi:hypothetical protein